MNYTVQQADIEVLRKSGVSADDITHSIKVAEKALEISRRIGGPGIDQELVGRGALFHDLGKCKTHEMEHGKIGAELGRKIGLPEEIIAIMEKHIRGGLTEAEAKELRLPVKDYTLRRLEERIVIYADRLVDIIYDGIVTLKSESESEARFEEILRTYPKYGKNAITLERYLGYHREIQGLMKKVKEKNHEVDNPRERQGRPCRLPVAHQEVRGQGRGVSFCPGGEGPNRGDASGCDPL